MNYTNKKGYPDFVVEYLKQDDYDHDDNTITATQLLKPARQYALEKQYKDSLTVDVDDLIPSRVGTAIHDSVERVKLSNCIQEKRLGVRIGKKKLTGKFDILHWNGSQYELIDIKRTSAWTLVYTSKHEDYKLQLSIYRFLATANRYDVADTGKVWFFFSDWDKKKALNFKGYPKNRIAIDGIKLYPIKEIRDFILNRVQLLESTALLDQAEMPLCTDEELWKQPDQYAVMKPKRKTSIKNFDSEHEALKYIEDKELTDAYVEHRPGTVRRCQYCHCTEVCTQYQDLVSQGLTEVKE